MAVLEKVWIGLYRWFYNQNEEGLVVKGSLRQSAHSWFSTWEGTAGAGPSLQAFPPWGTLFPYSSLVTMKDLFDQLECTFPSLLYEQHKASQMSFMDFCFTSSFGENSVKWRLLPSMLWGPCAKLFCPDLWDPAVCFSLSIRLNCVKLCSATLSHRAGLRPTSSFSHAT